ncbi:MAG: SulP family inorganic anion transporter [Gammaproteobacteria bacterium]|nr:SulP family inorganic anion transporter [Gammaproteobacteria bacterium]
MKIFNEFHLRNLRGDLFGGVTATVIALPMALAFGVASGAGAEAGIYGAIFVGLFASLFGGSSTLISEPTGPMTVVFTAVLSTLIAADPENGKAMAFTVVIMAGALQILFGSLKLGKYVTLMPYSVISGFMTGIGVILVILQLAPFLGHASPPGGVLGTLNALPSLLQQIQPAEAALAVLTVAILFLVPAKIKQLVPAQLIALVIGTLVSIWLLGQADLRRIGEIPTGLPSLQMPVFSMEQWRIMLIDAIALGMLGCIDALLTSVIADSMTGKQHDSDKELIGQGLGNMASGLVGGLPGAGATMGTVVNIQAGAQSAFSSLLRAGLLIVIVLWATRLTAVIPLAVLAGIALKVGLDIIDWRFLKRAHRLSAKGALITYGVIGLTVFVDLIVAVGIGLFVANVMTINKLSRLQADDVNAITDPEAGTIELSHDEKDLLASGNKRVLLLHMRGAMIFGSSRLIMQKLADAGDFQALLLDLREITHLGVSASLALEEVINNMEDSGKTIYIISNQAQPLERLRKLGALDHLPHERFISDRKMALEQAVAELTDSEETMVKGHAA